MRPSRTGQRYGDRGQEDQWDDKTSISYVAEEIWIEVKRDNSRRLHAYCHSRVWVRPTAEMMMV